MTTTLAAATNCWTRAEASLASMLAATSAFQLYAGASDETDALNYIHHDEYQLPGFGDTYTDVELEAAGRAHAIISSPTSSPYGKRRSTRNQNRFVAYGVLLLGLWRIVPEHETTEDDYLRGIERDLKNRAGDMIEELTADYFQALDTPIWVNNYDVSEGPVYVHPTSAEGMGEWQTLSMAIQWSELD